MDFTTPQKNGPVLLTITSLEHEHIKTCPLISSFIIVSRKNN